MTKKKPGNPVEEAAYVLSDRWNHPKNRLTGKKYIPRKQEIQALADYQKKMVSPSKKKEIIVSIDFYRKLIFAYAERILERESTQENPKLSKTQKEFLENYIKYVFGQSGKFPIEKSIYLYGPLGSGKSTIAKIISSSSAYLFNKGLARLENDYFNMGDSYRSLFGGGKIKEVLESLCKKRSVILDEIREKYFYYNEYGNKTLWINDVLDSRNNAWVNKRIQTIAIGNLSPRDLKKVINDSRLNDRIQQQYHIVFLESKVNFRK